MVGQGTDTTNNGLSNLIIFPNQIASPIANQTNTMEFDATNDAGSNDVGPLMLKFIGNKTNTMEIDATNDTGSNDVCPLMLKFPSQSKVPVRNSSSTVSK
jgi:hypothetical protein